MKKVLVIGSANVDFVIGVKDMPVVGETILCKSFERTLGGKGANQAYACGRLGADTVFLNVVGKDDFGNALIQNLKMANVSTEAVRQNEGTSTGMAVICVNSTGNNSIIVIPGANNCCDTDYLDQNRRCFEECDIVLLQMEIPLESVCYAVRLAKSLGKTVILNPAPVPDHIPEDIYQGLDFITPNESEFKRLTGCPGETIEDIVGCSHVLLDLGVKQIVVTLGERGAILINREGHKVYPPLEIQVIDTTAAGDTFNAAFVRKLADGATCDEALVFANYASALTVSKPGAQASIPSYLEVLDFINRGE